MLRLRVTLTFLVITLLGVTIAYMFLGARQTSLREALREDVEQSYNAYVQVKRLRDLELRDTAEAVGHSDVVVYLAVLEEFRQQMLEIEGQIYAKHRDNAEGRLAAVRGMTSFLDEFTRELADRMERLRGRAAWADTTRDAFVAKTRQELIRCQAQAVSQCFFQFTYYPLMAAVDHVAATNGSGFKPDIVVVTDDRFTGIANYGQPKWSDKTRFGEQYPIVRAAAKGTIVRDIGKFEAGTTGTYFLTAAPLLDGMHHLRGAVLVGKEIDDKLLAQEKLLLGHDVTYFAGQDPIRSTLDPRASASVKHAAPPLVQGSTENKVVESGDIIAHFIPVSGNWSNQTVRVAVSADPSKRLAALSHLKVFIPLVALAFFILGTLAFMFVLRGHFIPYQEIDSGIHEIINGNHDYEFPYEYKEGMWSSLAQNLNLMVGTLLNREMLDEDEFDVWADRVLHQGAPGGEPSDELEMSQARGEIERVSGKDALAREPADAYYHRIYDEFASYCEDADRETMPYQRFVEKVVRLERSLRDQHGAPSVRLRVQKTDKGPVLVPVRIDAQDETEG